ncbi:MAG: type I glyceraldehyde-3-phosphate dehydrogenase [Deltaproteobacteria bacterium]|nr:type I glyceraldehyde-3-phosphate dehydrogenase [Deltaproteobacteria bacterium]
MAKVAINGMGRIGRAALKIILNTPELELVAVNDLMPLDNLVYLLRYDTVYGRYDKKVEGKGNVLTVDGKEYKFFSERDPVQLPWGQWGIEVVFECTGAFTRNADLEKHLQAGAGAVILSAPPKDETVCCIVHGVTQPEGGVRILSCASCTTNCITPVVEVMGRRLGVKKAIMTTIHAYTSSQAIVDGPNKKFRRGRAGAANFVPTSTGAAVATANCLPQYKGKIDGVAVRGPVPSGSIADIVFLTERPTTVDEVNHIFREEAASPRYQGILGVAEDPIVSSDIIGDPRASVVDLEMTQVVDGDLVKVMSWYDNEWGYTSQMIREAVRLTRG